MFSNSLIKNNGWSAKYLSLKNQKFDLVNLQTLNLKKYPYLLESSSRGNDKNRYSILFYKPEIKLKKKKRYG